MKPARLSRFSFAARRAMQWEYRVVWTVDVIEEPSIWQTYGSRAKEYATGIERVLNQMASEGWQLVSSCGEPWKLGIYLFFRREIPEGSSNPKDTGIKEL
jgi:hypothetical protein